MLRNLTTAEINTIISSKLEARYIPCIKVAGKPHSYKWLYCCYSELPEDDILHDINIGAVFSCYKCDCVKKEITESTPLSVLFNPHNWNFPIVVLEVLILSLSEFYVLREVKPEQHTQENFWTKLAQNPIKLTPSPDVTKEINKIISMDYEAQEQKILNKIEEKWIDITKECGVKFLKNEYFTKVELLFEITYLDRCIMVIGCNGIVEYFDDKYRITECGKSAKGSEWFRIEKKV